MKRTFKKSLSLVLAVLMVFAVMPIAGAACEHVYDKYEYLDGVGAHRAICSKCNTPNYFAVAVPCSGGTATCASGAICTTCGGEYTEPSGVHVKGNAWVADKYLMSTANCNNPAYYYYPCAVCKEPVKDGTTFAFGDVDPNNHQYIYASSNDNKTHDAECGFCDAKLNDVACSDAEPTVTGATCTEGGKVANTCDACGYYWEETVAATGHSYTKESGVRRSDSTCTEFDTYWYMCANANCGVNAKDDANAQDKYYNGTSKLDHVYSKERAEAQYIVTAATCQQKATYYKSCATCDASSKGTAREATFEGAMGTHTWGEGTYNNDAQCGVDGTKTVTCVIPGCGQTDKVAAPGTALEHEYIREIQSEDRIRTTGNCQIANTYWLTCERCDDAWSNKYFFTGTTKGAHDFSGATIDESNYLLYNKVPATCTTLAVFYKYCTVCKTSSKGTEAEATFTFGVMLDHAYGEKIADEYIRVQATCDTGAIYSKSCIVCGHAKIPADVNVTDPNANVSVDDIFYGSKLGHDLKSTKAFKDSTCALDGNYEEFTCQRVLGGQACGFKTGGETIPKKDHVFKVTHEFRYPTCKTNGQYGQKKCDGCGTIVFFDANGETVIVPSLNMTATGHEDRDGDLICEKCDALLEAEDLCECICHRGENGGIMYFIIWIIKWFWRLTGSNQICACGNYHYN